MAKRRREKAKRFYNYECSLSGDSYRLTEKVENIEDLTSINAYYELNPEDDDRPAVIRKKLGLDEEQVEEASEEEADEVEAQPEE